MIRFALCLFVTASNLAMAAPNADDHLLVGAQQFREDHFDAALIEFRVAQKLGATDAAWYVAASLVKLGRCEEAIEAFAAADAVAPTGRDALLDYYRALAHYDLRLYASASKILNAVGKSASPRIAAQAQKIRDDISKMLAAEPSLNALDWYRSQGKHAQELGRRILSAAYFGEARELANHLTHERAREEFLSALKRDQQTAPVARE